MMNLQVFEEKNEDIKRRKDLPYSFVDRTNTAKLAMLPKATYTFNAIPIKLQHDSSQGLKGHSLILCLCLCPCPCPCLPVCPPSLSSFTYLLIYLVTHFFSFFHSFIFSDRVSSSRIPYVLFWPLGVTRHPCRKNTHI